MDDEFRAAIAKYTINYSALKEDLALDAPLKAEKETMLLDELPYAWRSAYLRMTNRETSLVVSEYNGFIYYFDNSYYHEDKGTVRENEAMEERVMGVIGKSRPRSKRGKATDNWLKGFIGPSGRRWGRQYDKGHFIAYSIGGGEQLNIFPQRGDLNRGHSERGKLFRKMEAYCARHPQTLCFHRPIYLDESACPAALDFGLLTEEGELWVETFDNRETPLDGKLFESQIPKGKNLNSAPQIPYRRDEGRTERPTE